MYVIVQWNAPHHLTTSLGWIELFSITYNITQLYKRTVWLMWLSFNKCIQL